MIAAAISSSGSARELLVEALGGTITVSLSALVLEESERNLSRKAPAALPAFLRFRDTLSVDVVAPTTQSILAVATHIAIKDAPIVAAAIQAQATYLATYDRRHLISQGELIWSRFRIVVALPEQVLQALRETP